MFFPAELPALKLARRDRAQRVKSHPNNEKPFKQNPRRSSKSRVATNVPIVDAVGDSRAIDAFFMGANSLPAPRITQGMLASV
jgi:hypothetical protein